MYQVYKIDPWKENKALIINIINFKNVPEDKRRDEAVLDTERLQKFLPQLGFKIEIVEEKDCYEAVT